MVLRSSLEEEFGVDSWNLRAEALPGARVLATLRTGEAVSVLGLTKDGEWLRVALPVLPCGRRVLAFAARFYRDPHRGGRLEAFVPSGAPELKGAGVEASGADGAGLSATDRAQALLQEFVTLRRSYERLPADKRDDLERARTARRIEEVISKLEFLGIPPQEVLNREDPMTLLLLLRGRSFAHRDFANPEAETCWLSCLFQSLWHSVVFHAAFELYLAPPRCSPLPGEKILTALQRTWAQYAEETVVESAGAKTGAEGEDEEEEGEEDEEEPAPRLVPALDLVEAFGEGYGDMSEALASIQNELSESSNPAAAAVAELIVLIPLSTLGETWPTPEMAWKQAEEWKVTHAPLIAVDLSLPAVTQTSSRHLARLWAPRSCQRAGEGESAAPRGSDLGPGHRLVALVCYLWNFRHYVAFCRRQRAPGRCLLFNDLPGLTHGAPRELEWAQVPEACYRYSLTPRLALYESLGAAEEVIRTRRLTANPPGPTEPRGAQRERPHGSQTFCADAERLLPMAAEAAQRLQQAPATGGPRQESPCTHQ